MEEQSQADRATAAKAQAVYEAGRRGW
jgi:hypothetical protein